MEISFLPKLAFEVLKNLEEFYKEHNRFDDKILDELYSIFGETFTLATELLENSKVIRYETCSIENPKSKRVVFKIISSSVSDQSTIYHNINFCTCNTFEYQVLEARCSLTCKHVLAVKLAEITGDVTIETVTNSQLTEFLNEQANFIEVGE